MGFGMDKFLQLGEGFGGGYVAGVADVHYADKSLAGIPPSGLGAIGLGLASMAVGGTLGNHGMGLAAGMAGGAGYRAGAWSAANSGAAAPPAATATVAGKRASAALPAGQRRAPVQVNEVERCLAEI